MRPLGIPTIRDRVTQMACKLVIEPIFEADFCETSHGFRPGRSAHDAAEAVTYAMNTGHSQVVDADVSKCFEEIPHADLLKSVAKRICDGAILRLIKLWLKAPIIEEDENGTRRNVGGGKKSTRGVPQGGVISPLLSNIHLHRLDRYWWDNGLSWKLGARIVRYADDIVILCRESPEQAHEIRRHVLECIGLRLSEEKTREIDSWEKEFDFLGFSFQMRRSLRTGNAFALCTPSRRSIKRISQRLRAITARGRTPLSLEQVVADINLSLRGWVNYFRFKNCSRAMARVKRRAEERLRTHLRERYKIRRRITGYMRFPHRRLYELGLYPVPVKTSW
jgi:group II intron reverse transcriptase/maturase